MNERKDIDVVFLDESMPGLMGLETLVRLKEKLPNMPVVMITKNEAEYIMEEAIGSQIDDYLIKPVNPNQILLTLKKIVDNKRLVSEKIATSYQQEFRHITMDISMGLDYAGWVEVYKKLISWELRLDESNNSGLKEVFLYQKSEANTEFFKFISKNYQSWIKQENGPLMSPKLMRHKVLPMLNDNVPILFLLLDNLRYDQWKIIEPIIMQLYNVQSEDYFYSILPTATQYSRNAIFAGMMPNDIYKKFPDYWLHDYEDGGKNMKEEELLRAQLQFSVKRDIKSEYIKVTNINQAKAMVDKSHAFDTNDLTVVVYNFIDTLSHSRTEMEVLKELAGDEKAYRSLTKSWFINSPVWAMMQKMAEKKMKIGLTTDHGTMRVQNPSKVIGDKETTTNLRYKVGRNLQFDKKDVFEIRNPEDVGLPKPNVSSTFIFAREDKFFLYPNNYSYYNNLYKDTFQHGGISLEEIICPIITLNPK